MATNGREGVELAEKLRPDVITMDYEMPVMDGISAVREIMKRHPAPVLMFSSLTYEGARVTLDALEAGAVDFLPKNFEEIARDSSQLQKYSLSVYWMSLAVALVQTVGAASHRSAAFAP